MVAVYEERGAKYAEPGTLDHPKLKPGEKGRSALKVLAPIAAVSRIVIGQLNTSRQMEK
jgi:hypothetical protein